MRKLTLEMAHATCLELVEEFGTDYIYIGSYRPEQPDVMVCSYTIDEYPSCLVGQIFARNGVPISVIKSAEGNGPGPTMNLFRELGVLDHDDDGLIPFLTKAQILQDQGLTWEIATADAHRYATKQMRAEESL